MVVIFVFLLVIPSARAITSYDITVQGSDILTNVTFELYTSSPEEKVNYWTTAFSLPTGSQILAVADSKGPIATYNMSEDDVLIETNKGGLKEKEVVTLVFKTNNVIDHSYAPLKRLNLSLAAFGDSRPDVPDEQTFAIVHVDDVISYLPSLGFVSQEDELTFAGEGPLSFTIWFGDGKKTKHFVVSGEANLSVVEGLFGLIPAVTGFLPEYERFPLAILPDHRYDREINEWSEGQFRSGLIVVRASAVEKDTFPAILLHETTHAVNERALRWDRTQISWFDEGVAQYIEFLVNQQLKVKQSEVFGKPVKWVEGSKIYSLPSRSSNEELWNYYQTGKTFMNTWNPDAPATREFGYAFSELLIRDYIINGGDLHAIFGSLLDQEESIDTPKDRNALIWSLLETDFLPCFSSNKDAFDACLKKANAYQAPVPDAVEIEGQVTEIVIPEIEEPEEEPLPTTPEGFFARLADLFQDLIDAIKGLLGL